MSESPINAAELRRIQEKLNYSNSDMGELLGISSKTWSNKISPSGAKTGAGKIQKLEYEFLLLLIGEHPKFKLIK